MSFQKAKEIHAKIIADREQKVSQKEREDGSKLKKKFHVLRLTILLYVLLAFFTLFGGFFFIIQMNQVSGNSVATLPMMIGVAASVITIMAIAEGIQVFLAIEENTRAMKEHFVGKDQR